MKTTQEIVTSTITPAPAVALATDAQASTAVTVIDGLAMPERSTDEIGKCFAYDENDNASLVAGSELKASELLWYVSRKGERISSETTRLANVIRLARALPAVTEGNLTVPAFAWVTVKLKANASTGSAFANMLGLIPALDIKDRNSLPATLSVFAVKNAIGWLKEREVINGEGKFTAKAVNDPVALALKEGVGATKLAKDIATRRELEKAAASGGDKAPATTPATTPATPAPEAPAPATPATPAPATPAPEVVPAPAPEAESEAPVLVEP
jgi:hypothetical protein